MKATLNREATAGGRLGWSHVVETGTSWLDKDGGFWNSARPTGRGISSLSQTSRKTTPRLAFARRTRRTGSLRGEGDQQCPLQPFRSRPVTLCSRWHSYRRATRFLCCLAPVR
jgi:hypothetical protein